MRYTAHRTRQGGIEPVRVMVSPFPEGRDLGWG